MMKTKQIKTALISVFHKDGLDELLKKLNEEGVKFLSTGGTQKFIESLGYECQTVESVTTYPSILGGRVKTLHPKVFGGILARRDNEGDLEQMKEYAIPSIDLVIVDLYPFEQTVASGASTEDIIGKIRHKDRFRKTYGDRYDHHRGDGGRDAAVHRVNVLITSRPRSWGARRRRCT